MPRFDRTLWRLAGKIHRRLRTAQSPHREVDLAAWRFTNLQTSARHLAAVISRRWTTAELHTAQNLRSQLNRYATYLSEVAMTIKHPAVQPVPTQRFLYDELQSLANEFEDVEFDLRQETITVTTPEITLEDIYLGSFRIILTTLAAPAMQFRVVAVTPCPAASRPEVTHPHVKSDQLCEGDATVPLERALRSGRLGDFFQIVQCTLQTYNDSSPYVSLSDWTGTSCRVCGASIASDETYYCELCEEDVCDQCSFSCSLCHVAGCANCTDSCAGCDDYCCRKCLTECEECQARYCPKCLPQKLCEDCYAATEEPDDDLAEESDAPTEPAVYTDRLGEAALLA